MSIVKDDYPRTHAPDCLNALLPTNGREWCVVRFSHGGDGFALHTNGGWSDKEGIALWTEEEAKSRELIGLGAHSLAATMRIRDLAFHIRHVDWRVRLYSNYDGSEVEMYVGRDYTQALQTFGLASAVVCSQEGHYLKAEMQGSVDAKVLVLV
jgi:hypothetical protein